MLPGPGEALHVIRHLLIIAQFSSRYVLATETFETETHRAIASCKTCKANSQSSINWSGKFFHASYLQEVITCRVSLFQTHWWVCVWPAIRQTLKTLSGLMWLAAPSSSLGQYGHLEICQVPPGKGCTISKPVCLSLLYAILRTCQTKQRWWNNAGRDIYVIVQSDLHFVTLEMSVLMLRNFHLVVLSLFYPSKPKSYIRWCDLIRSSVDYHLTLSPLMRFIPNASLYCIQ